MSWKRGVAACAVALMIAGTAQAVSLLPLGTAADESGFGSLYGSLNSPFVGGDFSGTLTSRVYVDATPATQVTFVYDFQIDLALSGIQDLSIAAVFPELDLRIGEVLSATHGYVTSTTLLAPDNADAYNNAFPTSDELLYGWHGTMLYGGDRAVMYMTTSGAVDVGEISAEIQNFSTASAKVLAPVDDPNNPDLNVPEPATLALLVLGGLFLRRR